MVVYSGVGVGLGLVDQFTNWQYTHIKEPISFRATNGTGGGGGGGGMVCWSNGEVEKQLFTTNQLFWISQCPYSCLCQSALLSLWSFHSQVIATPNAVSYDSLRWEGVVKLRKIELKPFRRSTNPTDVPGSLETPYRY